MQVVGEQRSSGRNVTATERMLVLLNNLGCLGHGFSSRGIARPSTKDGFVPRCSTMTATTALLSDRPGLAER
jgi:hypothetical protein